MFWLKFLQSFVLHRSFVPALNVIPSLCLFWFNSSPLTYFPPYLPIVFSPNFFFSSFTSFSLSSFFFLTNFWFFLLHQVPERRLNRAEVVIHQEYFLILMFNMHSLIDG